MSDLPLQPDSIDFAAVRERRSSRVMRERCEALRLLCWACDLDGRVMLGPEKPAEAMSWLQSPWMTDRIREVVRAIGSTTTATVEPLPDCWLMASRREETGLRPSDVTVAMVLGPGFTASSLASACNLSDTDAIVAALAPWMTRDAVRIPPLLEIIQWWQKDSEEIDDYAMATIDLSKQLGDMYEQLSAIYNIGRSMNNLTNPDIFVRTTCAQLLRLLRFNWIAVQYSDTPLALPECRGQLLVEGSMPCRQNDFMKRARKVISGWSGDTWTVLMTPDRDELASLVGSEVLADPIVHDEEVIGALLAGSKRGPDEEVSSHDMQLLDVMSDFLGVFHQNVARFEAQRTLFMGTVRALTASIDAKDPYTRGHSDRVAHLSAELAKTLGMVGEEIEGVYVAGIVHDVGKIGVPEATLCKPGKLTAEEFEQIKQHPRIGYDILKDIPPMSDVLPGVLHHHERWDGDGYPDRLAGEGIPLLGRLIAVADAFDAMSSNRSYRAAMPREKVLSILREGAGSQWDPRMIDAFLSMDLVGYDAIIAAQQRWAA